MTTETTIQSAIRARAAQLGVFLWRNNSGVLMDERGVPVRFGLGNDSARLNAVLKSSDLIGIAANGRFVAIECKAPGWIGPRTPRERAQQAWIELIKRNGGYAGFATVITDLDHILGV